jgi:hypothetical protein
MTADDFFLLFVAFGTFVIVPALLLWVFARIASPQDSKGRGTGTRRDVDPTDQSGHGQKKPVQSAPKNGTTSRISRRMGEISNWSLVANR